MVTSAPGVVIAESQIRRSPTQPGLSQAGDIAGHMSLWLTAAALHLHDWVAAHAPDLLSRHAHLAGYRAAAMAAAPDLSASEWAPVLTSQPMDRDTPLAGAARRLGLTDRQRLAFCLSALAEEDARIGACLSELQGSAAPYPTVETMARLFCGPQPALGAGWDLVAPMIAAGLLRTVPKDGPRASRCLTPAPLAWDIARGAASPALPDGLRLRPRSRADRIDALAYGSDLRDRLSRLSSVMTREAGSLLVLRHMQGADVEEIAASLAAAIKADLIVVDGSRLDPALSGEVGAVAVLTGALPFVTYAPRPGETLPAPAFGRWSGPVIVSMGDTGGLAPEAASRAITLDIPFPTPAERARAWRSALGTLPIEDLDGMSRRFQLPLGHIRNVARAALSETQLSARQSIDAGHIRKAARAMGREELDGLADLMPDGSGWEDLIVPDHTRALLHEFAQFCIHREALPKEMGQPADARSGRGVRALFTGPSGTGKTLAARLLGQEVGTDVYRVDLSAVVDKYVGETEKRLHQLLSRAEALDVILLLDEGDGLMAQRTDVRSSNDRFANLETNFLLQRLEAHNGIAVVTTNMPEGIDQAFQRRMDVVVPFSRPQADARLALWQRHLPAGHVVPDRVLLDLASRASLTGGQIKNAVRAAASLALSDAASIGPEHLWQGLAREMQKAGAMAGVRPRLETEAGASDDLSAFASHLSGDPS